MFLSFRDWPSAELPLQALSNIFFPLFLKLKILECLFWDLFSLFRTDFLILSCTKRGVPQDTAIYPNASKVASYRFWSTWFSTASTSPDT